MSICLPNFLETDSINAKKVEWPNSGGAVTTSIKWALLLHNRKLYTNFISLYLMSHCHYTFYKILSPPARQSRQNSKYSEHSF